MSSSIIYSRWSSLLLGHQTNVYFLSKCEMKTTIGGIAIDIFFLESPQLLHESGLDIVVGLAVISVYRGLLLVGDWTGKWKPNQGSLTVVLHITSSRGNNGPDKHIQLQMCNDLSFETVASKWQTVCILMWFAIKINTSLVLIEL